MEPVIYRERDYRNWKSTRMNLRHANIIAAKE
jgi:hypothetical protein